MYCALFDLFVFTNGGWPSPFLTQSMIHFTSASSAIIFGLEVTFNLHINLRFPGVRLNAVSLCDSESASSFICDLESAIDLSEIE